ncbi:zona pellucida sperm-binding protein 3-like [Odontesthes bonariensis]|uniref:zona pellucida sperm-binding protein 3-like n=1 Tax=Odontesthes bonariensis TaxID=219752 RepID=UPI003F588E0C
MVSHLYLGVIVLAVFDAAISDPDIKVHCGPDSVSVTWRVGPQLVPYAARLFLGSCMPSKWSVLPNGGGEAQFDYQLTACKFKKMVKGHRMIYQNEMSFRPLPKTKPAIFKKLIECVYKRPEGWTPAFMNPGAGVSEGRSKLVFHMALLNDQLTSVAKTNVIPLGSFMPIWVAVEQKSHQPLLLLMDECIAATTPELHPGSQIYPIIGNKGCLLESKRGSSMFLPRYHSSALILYLQSFKFGLGGEVYIHCNLVVWDPADLDEGKKACHIKEHGGWELLDDPSQSTLCQCCDSVCASRPKRAVAVDGHRMKYSSVLGPLIILEKSDSTNSTLVDPVTKVDF